MSQRIIMPTHLTPATVTAIKAAIAAVNALVLPIIIELSETQKKGLLPVGSNRAAELNAIEDGLMEPFPVTIPASFTLADYLALKQELADSNTLYGLTTTLANLFSVHGEIVGNNMMFMGMGVMDSARTMLKTVPAIKTAYTLIKTDHLTPSPSAGLTTYSIAPSAIVAVTGLRKGKKIINNGTTILTVLAKSHNATETLTINPGDSVDTPLGWVNVTVTNLSATTTGSFQVYK